MEDRQILLPFLTKCEDAKVGSIALEVKLLGSRGCLEQVGCREEGWS